MGKMALEKWMNLSPRPPIKRVYIGDLVEEIDFKNNNNKIRVERKEPERKHINTCKYCKKEFLGYANQKYCCKKCGDAYIKPRGLKNE